VKKLEFENQTLTSHYEQMKENYDLQSSLLKESYENRINMLRNNFETIKKHYETEKELFNKQIELIEKEKQDLVIAQRKKHDDLIRETNIENQRLKDLQKTLFDDLKNEHEQALKRMKELKVNEVDAALSASSHTRTIETVLNSIFENTKNIDSLSQKVEINHMMNLSEKETEIRLKKDHLKCLYVL
jgi:Fas-binding factor 1